ncbi:hypothetical protein I5803_16730 [Caenimonas sp. DR4.4]|uniref:Uncharacterized protein n=2 Tax=Caenimonas aquaedulcis TaxID=2793270 RepID=A0A931H761_9BURK|nr:hypothetical protein [Caenimonas aquaedulcis]
MGLASAPALAYDSGSLKAKYTELQAELQDPNNTFRQPVHVDSSQSGDNLSGEVYAVVPHAFKDFEAAMKDPSDWCDILILPFNTKYCHAAPGANGAQVLQVRIGRKSDQPVDEAYRIDFALQPVAASAQYFESRLTAPTGPVGTRDYRIAVSAVPLEGNKTFMHLSYSYGYGATGRFAMGAYLSTVGASKVGFTVTGKDANGQPVYIGGVRGAIERNVMRYYLAINAHLASMSAAPAQRLEKRIQTWFDSTERYPRQLREMDRSAYVAMKRTEAERQLTALQ